MPTTFAVGIDENPLYATRAEQDKNGDQIDLTYAKKSEVPSQLSAASGLTIISDVIGAKVDGTTITINQNGELESIGGGGGGDVFYATYGVTTFNEIVTANQAGKTVVLQKATAFGESGYSLPLQTIFISNIASSSYAYFSKSPRFNYVNGDLPGDSVYAVDGNDTWTTSAVYPISYPTSADVGKVLTSTRQGRVSWEGSVDNWNEAYNVVSASAQIWNEAAAMDEYPVSAGPGISIDNVSGTLVFSSQAQMNIVAGSGIIIDNPDSNTVIVSQKYPSDETVLFSSTSNVSSCTLSESIQNFERFKIGVRTNSGEMIFEFKVESGSKSYDICTARGNNQAVLSLAQFTVSGNSMTVVRTEGILWTWGSNPSYRHNYADDMNLFQTVYGVHRISGGN